MTTTASVSLSNNLVYSVTETLGGDTNRYNDSLGYARTLVYGTGEPPATSPSQANVFAKTVFTVSAGASTDLNFQTVPKQSQGNTFNVSLDKLKAFVFSNDANGNGYDITFFAPPTSGCTGVFNGESGNLKVPSLGTYQYNDIWGNTVINSNNAVLRFDNASAVDIQITALIVGVNDSLTQATIQTP